MGGTHLSHRRAEQTGDSSLQGHQGARQTHPLGPGAQRSPADLICKSYLEKAVSLLSVLLGSQELIVPYSRNTYSSVKEKRQGEKKKSHVSKSTEIQLALFPKRFLAAHLGLFRGREGDTSPLLTQREALGSHALSSDLSADCLYQKALALSSIKMPVYAVKATKIFPKPQKSLTDCDFLHQL